MHLASNGPERDRLRELTSAMMDGTATDTQCRELTEMLYDNPPAQDEYIAFVDLHAVLSKDLGNHASSDATSLSANSLSHRSWCRADDTRSQEGSPRHQRAPVKGSKLGPLCGLSACCEPTFPTRDASDDE